MSILNLLNKLNKRINKPDKNIENKILEFRKSIFENSDSSILSKHGNFHNKSGICLKEIDSTLFSCLYIKGSSKKLFVSYMGTKNKGFNYLRNPFMPRWSYHNMIDGYFLGISDPMIFYNKSLEIGWYYGTSERSYLLDTLKIVEYVCRVNDIPHTEVTFMGSSGGGYAALMASIHYPDSISISLNPQIIINNYPYAEKFSKEAKINLGQIDRFNRNSLIPLIENSPSKHLILINAASQQDYYQQLIPVLKKYDIKINYGLTVWKNCLFWLYYAKGAPNPHSSLETKYIFIAIEHIANLFKNGDLDMEAYQSLIILINEAWNDIYDLKYEIYKLNKHKENQNIIIGKVESDAWRISSTINNLTIEAKDIKNNFYGIQILKGKSAFKINMYKICSDTCTDFSYELFDVASQRSIYAACAQITGKYEFTFINGNEGNCLELRVYPGKIGKTNFKDLKIEKVEISVSKNINL